MNAFDLFLAEVKQLLPRAEIRSDPAAAPSGSSFAEIVLPNGWVSVEWTRQRGFAIQDGRDTISDTPSIIVSSPDEAVRQALGILGAGSTSQRARSLAEIRLLCGISQSAMAKLMGVSQASISQLESRKNPSVESLGGYVSALGGELLLTARFPNWETTIGPADAKVSALAQPSRITPQQPDRPSERRLTPAVALRTAPAPRGLLSRLMNSNNN